MILLEVLGALMLLTIVGVGAYHVYNYLRKE